MTTSFDFKIFYLDFEFCTFLTQTCERDITELYRYLYKKNILYL